MAPREGATGLEGLVTESRREDVDYSVRSTRELVELMNREDASVPAAVGSVAGKLSTAIDAIVERLRGGGRLIYVGAGSSGAIAALDADECEATFSTEPGQVVALVAGTGLTGAAREAAEDDVIAGAGAVEELGVSDRDALVGVTASGRTPYVLAALERARAAGAVTVAVVSAHGSELSPVVD
ncbi:MAG TPA: SIS domain-containing protein, partial [Gaiellaceae bacterium]|nr:SIS domain-containing protein [Gaiellaceae bacterium]